MPKPFRDTNPSRKQARSQTKIRPELKQGEKDTLNPHWRGLFLDKLAETSNVTEAAKFAGANPARAYKIRREEPEFARLWHAALVEGYEHLELDLLARLRAGEAKDGPKYDNGAALRLLALPEALGWYMDKVFPVERRVVRSLRPVLGRAVGVPLPHDRVFGAV